MPSILNPTLNPINQEIKLPAYTVSIAPMMDWTDRHFRYFLRFITNQSLLYTEMVTTGAILNGNKSKLLDFSKFESPVSLQLGGDNPVHLAECAKIGEGYGYSEINLNVGCPSDRVQNGNFGACLMATPDLVAKGLEAMKKVVSIPVTIKHRIGIDNLESYEDLHRFVKIISESGVDRFIVHARIARLKGLSPAENRTIPPLRYKDVYELKKNFPKLKIEINGGVKSIPEIKEHLKYVDGVMIGRAAYENPYFLKDVNKEIFSKDHPIFSRKQLAENFQSYIHEHISNGGKLHHILRHTLGLCNGIPGARKFRRILSERMYDEPVNPKLFSLALSEIQET